MYLRYERLLVSGISEARGDGIHEYVCEGACEGGGNSFGGGKGNCM